MNRKAFIKGLLLFPFVPKAIEGLSSVSDTIPTAELSLSKFKTGIIPVTEEIIRDSEQDLIAELTSILNDDTRTTHYLFEDFHKHFS